MRFAVAIMGFCVSCLLSSSAAFADYDTAYFGITYVSQAGTNTMNLYSDRYFNIPTSSVACGTSSTGQFYVQDTTGTTYASIAPYILAAFLNNKQVSLHLSSTCTGWNLPIVTGVTVQN